VLEHRLGFRVIMHDHHVINNLETGNVSLTTAMAGLQVKEFRVGVTFRKIGDSFYAE
jgi:hypothetical protein